MNSEDETLWSAEEEELIRAIIDSNDPTVQEDELKKFVDVYYPISIDFPAINDVSLLPRKVWYCNVSGIFISELQDRLGGTQLEIQNNENTEAAAKLYSSGYNHYNIYPCGHCILDVFMISILFEHMKFPCIETSVDKSLEYVRKMCPICPHGSGKSPHGVNLIYYIGTPANSDIVILEPTIIPKKYLPYTSENFAEGDIIDTDTGLCIFDGKEFVDVRKCEYYPIWPLKYLKQRGYRYYLDFTELQDAIPFEENAVFLSSVGMFIPSSAISCETDEKPIDAEFFKTLTELEKYDRIEIPQRINLSEFNIVPYPFSDYTTANSYLLGGKHQAQINKNELLVFYEGTLLLSDTIGTNIIVLTY